MNKLTKSLVAILVLASISHFVEAKKVRKQYFNQLEFDVSFDITHPIMTANFLGKNQKELMLLGENEKKEKIVSLFSYQTSSEQYSEHAQLILPAKTIAFDLLTNHMGIEVLLLLDSEGLSTLNFQNMIVKPLAEISTIYLNSNPQFIVRKTMVFDFNGDKLDDISASDFSNRSFYLQKPNGEFELNELPIKATVDMSKDNISYSESRIFSADTNFDQLLDVVKVENNQLVVFEQNEMNQFGVITNVVSLPNDISSLPWWFVRGADGESVDQSNLQHRMVEKLEDINGDNIVDLMVRQTQSSGVLDRKNVYEIHYGQNDKGELKFDQEPDTKIAADGTLSGLEVIDFNNDGRKEILVSSFDIGISQIIGALMSGSIDQDVYLFSLDSADKYNSEPLFSEEVDLNFSLSSGSAGQPVILSADFNGDGFKDMMLSAGEKKLVIYQGSNDEEMFESRSSRYKLALPQDGSMLSIADLNIDGKDEVIVRYGKQDDPEFRRKVVILSVK